ncbi:MAG: DUF4124 domain-containing protein [Smithella sp.]|jgi:hypothetical protein
MKQIIFTLCVFIVLATVGNAATFYNCVDSEGNSIITDNPPPGAKCKSTEMDDESSAREYDSTSQRQKNDVEVQQEKQHDKTTSQNEEIKRLKSIPRPSY